MSRQPLAIEGGPPHLPEGPPTWPRPDEEVRAALAAAYADGSWGKYFGPHCDRLIEALQTLLGVRHAALFASGTVAVELALRGLKIGPGDEVILAAYDFPGNFRAIEAVGARPVLVDLEANGWCIDPVQAAAAARPQTRAIIASHLHGSMVDMAALREVADRLDLAIIEDACQTPGATVGGKAAGTWGDVGVFSFGGSKLLTAGRGGAVITDRPEVVQRIKVFTERGNEAYPLSELQAAVLLPQIRKLADDNARRLANAQRLLSRIEGLLEPAWGLAFPAPTREGAEPAFYKLPGLLGGGDDDCSSSEFELRRRRFLDAVQAEGVALAEGFRGFARRTTSRCRAVGDLAQARRAAAGTVLLHHPVLLEDAQTIDRVAEAIGKVARALLA